jgi:hypothetical protein
MEDYGSHGYHQHGRGVSAWPQPLKLYIVPPQ